MKAVITSASEVEINGTQSVTFDIYKGTKMLVSASASGDVDTLRDTIQGVVLEYQNKYQSENKLKEGDEVDV